MAQVTDPIMLDSTGQAIKNSIDLLSANINRTASNIPYDSNLTIKGKIDEIDGKTADDIPYSSGVSVKDKIDSKADLTAVPFRGNRVITITSLSSITESGIYRINTTDDDANKPEVLAGKTCFIIAFTYGLKTLFIRPYYPWEGSYGFFVANTGENGVVERTTWRRITTATS